MFTTVWEYEVPPERREAFIEVYGPAGRWAGLFRRAPGYRETVLLEDVSEPGRFVTFDRWDSRRDFEAFLAADLTAYDTLDAETAGLTRAERHLGSMDSEWDPD